MPGLSNGQHPLGAQPTALTIGSGFWVWGLKPSIHRGQPVRPQEVEVGMGVPQPSHPETLCRAGLSAPRSQEGGTDSCSHHGASRTRADSSLAQPQARLFWEGRRVYFCSLTTQQSISDLSLRPTVGAATEAALYPGFCTPTP